MKVPKNLPAWMSELCDYMAEKEDNDRTPKAFMRLCNKYWETFHAQKAREAEAAARKKKRQATEKKKKKEKEIDAQSAGGSEGDEREEGADPGKSEKESAIAQYEEKVCAISDSLREALEKQYAASLPRRSTSSTAAAAPDIGPGSVQEDSAEGLYSKFLECASLHKIDMEDPIIKPVERLYVIASSTTADGADGTGEGDVLAHGGNDAKGKGVSKGKAKARGKRGNGKGGAKAGSEVGTKAKTKRKTSRAK